MNNVSVEPSYYDEILELPEKYLKIGRNILFIEYRNKCSENQFTGLLFEWADGLPSFHTQF